MDNEQTSTTVVKDYVVVTSYRHPLKSKGIVHTFGMYTRTEGLRVRREFLRDTLVTDGYEFRVHVTKLVREEDMQELEAMAVDETEENGNGD